MPSAKARTPARRCARWSPKLRVSSAACRSGSSPIGRNRDAAPARRQDLIGRKREEAAALRSRARRSSKRRLAELHRADRRHCAPAARSCSRPLSRRCGARRTRRAPPQRRTRTSSRPPNLREPEPAHRSSSTSRSPRPPARSCAARRRTRSLGAAADRAHRDARAAPSPKARRLTDRGADAARCDDRARRQAAHPAPRDRGTARAARAASPRAPPSSPPTSSTSRRLASTTSASKPSRCAKTQTIARIEARSAAQPRKKLRAR